METTQLNSPLVQVQWLAQNVKNKNVVVLDATLPKAVVGDSDGGVSTHRIPGARFFDIKNTFSITTAAFPNTRIDGASFNEKARLLGINKDSVIIVYDDHGIYSSARAWWMFKAMGHHQVAVLDGGLKSWLEAGYNTEEKTEIRIEKGNFEGIYKKAFFKDSQDVLAILDDELEVVVDARASDRFEGLVEEPREGLRSGHIPNAVNLPYTDLLKNGKMHELTEIQNKIKDKFSKDKNITFSCGSGITACVLALGAELAGFKNLSIYDGSWTEWGSIDTLPIETGK
ncbi:sulfurtransferase [Lutimonas halocynthiae]|uniref:sulfurtransferase n=1 Tax=Lutimonas halocynthiae TaxID=1446477 RepID=UPI0025B5239B|nr:sulfurtransferase [Lutimonas halocynthiae]MDN3643856.1 sulfurtransferase [Lutimonas halocynthiae]